MIDINTEVFTSSFQIQTLTRGAQVVENPNWYQVVSPNNKTPSANEVIHSKISEADVHSTIEKTIQQYQDLGTPFKWCTSPFTSPIDMGKILESYNFGSWPARGMYYSLEQIDIPALPDIHYEGIDDKNLEEYMDAYFNGWWLDRTPSEVERQNLKEDLRWSLQNRRAHYFLARAQNSEVAGTAGFFQKKNSVYLVGGNVLRKYRGQGIYRGLIAMRLNEARKLGLKLAVTGARERTSAPILEKLGFKTAFRSQIYQFGGVLPE